MSGSGTGSSRLERVERAVREYDGDACRPEYGIDVRDVARLVLNVHWDLAACFCPTCALAREVLRDNG